MCSIDIRTSTHTWLNFWKGTWTILIQALVDLKQQKPYSFAFGSEGLSACRLRYETPCGHERPAPSLFVGFVVYITV